MSTSSADNFGAPEPGSIGYNTRDPAYYPTDMPSADSDEALYWSPIDTHYRAVMLEDTDSIGTAAAAWRAFATRYRGAASSIRALGADLERQWTSPEAKRAFLREVGMLTASLDEWADQAGVNAAALENLAPTVASLKTSMRDLYNEYIAEAERLKAEDDEISVGIEPQLEDWRDIGDVLFGSRNAHNTEAYSARSRTEILEPLATAFDVAAAALSVGTHYQGRTDAQVPSAVPGVGGTPGAPSGGAPGAPGALPGSPGAAPAAPSVSARPAMPTVPTIPGTPPVLPPGLVPPSALTTRPHVAQLVQPPTPVAPTGRDTKPGAPAPPSSRGGSVPAVPSAIAAPSAGSVTGAPLSGRGRAPAAPAGPGAMPAGANPSGAGPKPLPAMLNPPGGALGPTAPGQPGGAPGSHLPMQPGARPPASLTGHNGPASATPAPPMNSARPTLGGRTTNRPPTPIGGDPKSTITHGTPTGLLGRSGKPGRRTPTPITSTEIPKALRAPRSVPARMQAPAYDVHGPLAGRAGNLPVAAAEQSAAVHAAVRQSLTGLAQPGATATAKRRPQTSPTGDRRTPSTQLVGGTELFEVAPAPEGPGTGAKKARVTGRTAVAE